jgi:hypothetical protein
MGQIDKLAELGLRLQFLQLTMQMCPLVPLQKAPEIIGGAVKLKQACALCMAEREIPDLGWITYQRNLDFEHAEGCTYAKLVDDFMVQMAQPTDLLNDERS